MEAQHDDEEPLVCVLCGAPWEPRVQNRCRCGGFCSWGRARGAPPLSWQVTRGGRPRHPGEDDRG
jgi:hypothetical protein